VLVQRKGVDASQLTGFQAYHQAFLAKNATPPLL